MLATTAGAQGQTREQEQKTNEQQPPATPPTGSAAASAAEVPAEVLGDLSEDQASANKKFTFFTKASIYMRYGGVRIAQPTTLIGYSDSVFTSYATLANDATPDELADLVLNDFIIERNYGSYDSPLTDEGNFRFDPYELLLGFDARVPLISNMDGGVRIAFDMLEAGELLAGSDWGGREVYPAQHFDSGPLREGFAYLDHPKWGKFTFGITEGVAARLDGGARDISVGSGGLFGDFSRTPWQVHRLGLPLGQASSENFPKIQYLSPRFYGVGIGFEWFTNGQSASNRLTDFPYLENSGCLPNLFYENDKLLGRPGIPAPVIPQFFPKGLVTKVKCWQLSSPAATWNAQTSRFIMGGNFAVAYEKEFKKDLALKLAGSYGILSSTAQTSESRHDLIRFFNSAFKAPTNPNQLSDSNLLNNFIDFSASDIDIFADSPLDNTQIIHSASSLDQAVSFGALLSWQKYAFFGGITYLFPSEYKFENLGGEKLSDLGTEGFIWSVGIKADRLIPTRGGKGKKGGFSVSCAQAITKNPRLDGGQEQKAILLNVGSSYPLANGVELVVDYWYGDAALSVPFLVSGYPPSRAGYTFYEQRLIQSHEFAVGLKMQF